MKRNPDEIRSAIQHSLSGLEMTDQQRAAIRAKLQGGGKTVKRKRPLALLVALAIMLMTVTAYAITNWEQIKDYLSHVRKLSHETMGWPLEDRLALVELMHEAGLVSDEAAYAKLHEDGLSDEEKTLYSDRIIEARYGKDWYWTDYDSIEAIEWPEEKRYESLENLIEYEKWRDQQDREWQQTHPDREEAFHLLTEAEAMQVFREALIAHFGFTEESMDQNQFILNHFTDERIWDCHCILTAEHPGWHTPTPDDQLNRFTDEMTVMEYIKRYSTPDFLRDAVREDSIDIALTMDDWGRDPRLRTMDMEHTMIEHMHSTLTEIYSFTYDSVETDRIQVHYDDESRIWTAAYTIDADHPGVYDNIPGEHEADTVYEAQCMWHGEQPSFTFTDQKTFLNRNPNEDPQPPYDEGFIGEEKAVQAARKAVLDGYACGEEALDEMTVSVQTTQNDGRDEYYIEFIGYDHFSANLARLWNYAARVDAETGDVIAAVSREDWEPMTGQRLAVDDTNREFVQADQRRRALLRAAGETDADMETGAHLYLKNGLIWFMDWTLEEKAEYSHTVKPRIDQFMAAHPEDVDFYLREGPYTVVGYYIATTRHVYGLPDDRAIPQEAAFENACQAIHDQYGTDLERLKKGRTYVYYDVTDPESPRWKFHIDILNTAVDMDTPPLYYIELDAYTGQTVLLRVQSPRIPGESFTPMNTM